MNQIESLYKQKVERSFLLSCSVIDKIPNLSKLKKKLFKKKAKLLCQEEIDILLNKKETKTNKRLCKEEVVKRIKICKCKIYCFCVDENNKWIR